MFLTRRRQKTDVGIFLTQSVSTENAFKGEILETCSSLELANEREKHWINYFDTRNSEKGFNLALGGGSQPHPIRRNPWNNPEYRAKQTALLISVTQTPQARANNKAALNTPKSRAKRTAISKALLLARPELSIGIRSVGKTRSHEHQHKLNEARRRQIHRKHSPEYFNKIEEKRKLRTHFACKSHGLVPLDECYHKITRGYIRYECRQCRKALKERWRQANLCHRSRRSMAYSAEESEKVLIPSSCALMSNALGLGSSLLGPTTGVCVGRELVVSRTTAKILAINSVCSHTFSRST